MQTPALLGKMPRVVAQAHRPFINTKDGLHVRQLTKLVQVAQVAGQEMQFGESRYVPGRQEVQVEIAPLIMVQLTQPIDSISHWVQVASH